MCYDLVVEVCVMGIVVEVEEVCVLWVLRWRRNACCGFFGGGRVLWVLWWWWRWCVCYRSCGGGVCVMGLVMEVVCVCVMGLVVVCALWILWCMCVIDLVVEEVCVMGLGGGGPTRLGIRLVLLLGDDGCRLEALGGGDGGGRVQSLHPYGRGLETLRRDGCRLQGLGADLGRLQTDAVHGHQMHGVEMDRGGHSHPSRGRQGRAGGLRGH